MRPMAAQGLLFRGLAGFHHRRPPRPPPVIAAPRAGRPRPPRERRWTLPAQREHARRGTRIDVIARAARTERRAIARLRGDDACQRGADRAKFAHARRNLFSFSTFFVFSQAQVGALPIICLHSGELRERCSGAHSTRSRIRRSLDMAKKAAKKKAKKKAGKKAKKKAR